MSLLSEYENHRLLDAACCTASRGYVNAPQCASDAVETMRQGALAAKVAETHHALAALKHCGIATFGANL